MNTQQLQKREINIFMLALLAFVMLLLSIHFYASTYTFIVLFLATALALSFIIAQLNLASIFVVMVLMIPVSTNQNLFNSEISLRIPSEPIEAIITMAFCIKILFGYKVSKELLKHPVFIILCLGLVMQCIATTQSSIPIVSIKSMILKISYFIVFFVLAADLYIKQQMSHFKILKSYLLSIIIIGIIIFLQHLEFGLTKDTSGTATEPFFADHTIYSACLAIIIPLPMVTLIHSKKEGIGFGRKGGLIIITLILLIFFFLTYCRAGWLSLIIASILVLIIVLGLRFSGLMLFMLSTFLILYIFKSEIEYTLRQNKADSNAKNATLEQQTKSVANITNDQSNAERLNRWSCAWRMFIDKPYWGFGPGTYQFEYLSYQKKSEMTRISITQPYNVKKGKGGTAHSEYLLMLSESGIFSFLFQISSILATLYYALKVYGQSKDIHQRIKIMIIFFGFCTYILHSFFNNFLDTDKAALLYYTSIAGIITEAIIFSKKSISPNPTPALHQQNQLQQ